MRKHWGWGATTEPAPTADAAAGLREHLGFGGELEEAAALESIELAAPRLPRPPVPATDDHHARVTCAHGASYVDVVDVFRGKLGHAPEWVLQPTTEHEIATALEWAGDVDAYVIPRGGGTSVVGGVTPDRPGTVVLDLAAFDGCELDTVSRSARLGAGLPGPAVEEALKPHGMTMRFFPQSFEFSTLGGWVATRAGGHFATGPTHVDDLVESVRAITPQGIWESRRLPGSGAGPSPDRMLIGSEGILGVITEAWVKVRPRPTFKASATVHFDSFEEGADVVRLIAQSGLYPTNCRLLDEAEGRLTGVSEKTMLVLGFESAHHPVDHWMQQALEICGREPSSTGSGAGGDWRSAFLAMPYLRDTLIQAGVLNDTFETAITWDKLGDLRAAVKAAVPHATCRFTHVYPDGPAPYFTVVEPARRGHELEQWDEIKARASDAVISAGGTITHHHAVGRDHRPWYDVQRPEAFAQALRAAKSALDPGWILNPGTLISK